MNAKTAKKLRAIARDTFDESVFSSQYKKLKKIYITLSPKVKKEFLQQLNQIKKNER